MYFKNQPHFERDTFLGREIDRKSQKLFPFIKMVRNHGVSIHLSRFTDNSIHKENTIKKFKLLKRKL